MPKFADKIDPDYRATASLGAIGFRLAKVLGQRVGTIDQCERRTSAGASTDLR